VLKLNFRKVWIFPLNIIGKAKGNSARARTRAKRQTPIGIVKADSLSYTFVIYL
jgi:hypothetical protein